MSEDQLKAAAEETAEQGEDAVEEISENELEGVAGGGGFPGKPILPYIE